MKKILLSFFLILTTIMPVSALQMEAVFDEENNTKEVNFFNQQIRASHILVGTKRDADILRQKIIDGELTFENAAKQYSRCPSRFEGGDLGYFGRGAMVPAFEGAAFNLPLNEISEPVETRFGWHLIKVIDKK